MDIKGYVIDMARRARAAARVLGGMDSGAKNRALGKMADALEGSIERLIVENAKDLEAGKAAGLNNAILDRLALNNTRIRQMAVGLREIAALPDPVGEITGIRRRPNGMQVGKMRVPIGVIGFIFESRPNVTADSAGLCLKAGNAVILKGGSEAINSNKAIIAILREAAVSENFPPDAIGFIDVTDRQAVMELLKLDDYIDVIIPRGGEGLIRAVTENSRIPVLKHFKGVCHVYVDGKADLKMASDICFNAKVQRPGTCNAMETMLVDREISPVFLPEMLARLKAAGVRIKGCVETRAVDPAVEPASPTDYHTEYLDLAMNCRVVGGMDEAMDHIAEFGSLHTETIVTGDYARAMRFLREVDSSAVMVNASTRLNDGFEFGLGAEIGIATTKLHARGPMGLEELTSLKFIVLGSGQLRM
ncbi:MAG: glutamate-5-semialdehyde dehydrogenase [Nitrospirae bacterium]|nr:glutamate-5-semialdehyde dehydrogenase [Nitrospirota bacterium]